MSRRAVTALALALCACTGTSAAPKRSGAYLYAFAGADSTKAPATDFLAVIDADPRSPRYAHVIATAPIHMVGTMPHHMELVMPGDGRWLFANGFMSGRIFLFDLADPLAPRLATTVDSIPGFSKPHSFWRLADGRVVATLQYGNGKTPGNPGGIALLDPRGHVLRTSSAADPAFPGAPIRTYSLDVAPDKDLIITTSAPMDDVPSADVVQLWRLSDLKLLHTFAMPSVAGDSTSRTPFEVRFLPGDSLAVLDTWHCGLYLLSNLGSAEPRMEHVFSLPQPENSHCGVPLVMGHYWIVPVATARAFRVYDITDPRHPSEASVLRVDPPFKPHWTDREPGTDRVVLTSNPPGHRILLARFDSAAGVLSLDSAFRDPGATRPGVSFDRQAWPHGAFGPATPHGTIFSAPGRGSDPIK